MADCLSAKSVANYYLRKARDEGRSLTVMSLLKIVYFAYAWYLALLGQPLFKEKIEAWRYGPVIPDLWQEFTVFGSSPITQFANNAKALAFFADRSWQNETQAPFPQNLEPWEQSILDGVWDSYKNLSPFQLSAITHAEGTPWSKAIEKGQNTYLSDEDIKTYYETLKNRG